ncbi:unnamed protein product [Schistocephalus solidus]|uniref:Secreted protein n=1 Tax=Schistocephalus solidus TaxID=70667 RepID=A0A183SAW7_SCHSO|nr:unnamed protein product [Schistocephalus solidus]
MKVCVLVLLVLVAITLADDDHHRECLQRNLCGIPPPAIQHLLPPSDAGEGNVDAPMIAALAAAGICSRSDAGSIGRAGDQGDPRCRRLDGSLPRRLQDEAPTSTPAKAPSNQITQKLDDLHALDNNANVETRWCQQSMTCSSQTTAPLTA